MQAVKIPQQQTKKVGISSSEQPIINLVRKEESTIEKIEKELALEAEEVAYEIKHYLVYAWHKLAIIILTFHGIAGVWESLKFILFEYPELESQLAAGLINNADMNTIISGITLTFLTTFISIVVAIRLHKVREKTSVIVELIVATILIITKQFLQDYLLGLNLLQFFQ